MGYFKPHLASRSIELFLCQPFVGSTMHKKFLYEGSLIFPGNVLRRVADLVNDTKLHFGIGINRGIGKFFQVVNRSDQGIPATAISQIG